MNFYGSNEAHSADGQTRISQAGLGDWWRVYLDGKLVGGFATRETARLVIRVGKMRKPPQDY